MTKILIIDDDQLDRESTTRALKKFDLDLDIYEATTAFEAIALMEEHVFDCIFLDYHLPGMHGLTFLKELHDKEDSSHPPVIMLTGQGNELVAVEALKLGAYDYLPKSSLSTTEVYKSLSQTLDRVRLETEQQDAHKALEFKAMHDSLTGLGNRRLLEHDLIQAIKSSDQTEIPFCFAVMDLDYFKAINDLFGHQAGDYVLSEVSKRLIKTGKVNDQFYRMGGDEFAAIIQVPNYDEAIIEAMHLKEKVAEAIAWHESTLSVCLSIGLTLYMPHSDEGPSILAMTDRTMFKAKKLKLEVALSSIPNQIISANKENKK